MSSLVSKSYLTLAIKRLLNLIKLVLIKIKTEAATNKENNGTMEYEGMCRR